MKHEPAEPFPESYSKFLGYAETVTLVLSYVFLVICR